VATDATGTPTDLGIPKYNPNVDAPSGLGFNAAMDAIDALIQGRMEAPDTPADGDVPVWDSATSTWVKSSSAQKMAVSGLAPGTDGQVLTTSAGAVAWGAGATFVGARAKQTVAQSIPDNAFTTITFDAEDYDTDGFHSTSSNTSRLTVPSGLGGYYLIVGAATHENSGVNHETNTKLLKNGVEFRQRLVMATGSSHAGVDLTEILSLAAGDYIEIQHLQVSGAARNTMPAGTFLAMVKIG